MLGPGENTMPRATRAKVRNVVGAGRASTRAILPRPWRTRQQGFRCRRPVVIPLGVPHLMARSACTRLTGSRHEPRLRPRASLRTVVSLKCWPKDPRTPYSPECVEEAFSKVAFRFYEVRG